MTDNCDTKQSCVQNRSEPFLKRKDTDKLMSVQHWVLRVCFYSRYLRKVLTCHKKYGTYSKCIYTEGAPSYFPVIKTNQFILSDYSDIKVCFVDGDSVGNCKTTCLTCLELWWNWSQHKTNGALVHSNSRMNQLQLYDVTTLPANNQWKCLFVVCWNFQINFSSAAYWISPRWNWRDRKARFHIKGALKYVKIWFFPSICSSPPRGTFPQRN